MPTGDLKNNLRKLKAELKRVNYKDEVDWEKINIGLTEPFLPMLHFLLADFSHAFSVYLLGKGYDFFGKSDLRFMEVLYKILVQEFGFKPMLTKQQFFSIGFAEVKVMFVTKILSLCHQKSCDLTKSAKSSKKKVISKKNVSISNTSKLPSSKMSANANTDFSLNSKSHFSNSDIVKVIHENVRLPMPKPELDITIDDSVLNCEKLADLDILDITELEDEEEKQNSNESNTDIIPMNTSITTSRAEIVEENYDESAPPQFIITKHDLIPSNDEVAIKLPMFDECNPKKLLSEETKAVEGNTQQNCNKCLLHVELISGLTARLENLEKSFSEIVSINSELSAKVVILETKLNFLEDNQNIKNGENIEHQKNCEAEKEADEDELENEEHVDFSVKTTANNIQSVQPTSKKSNYSPIKYTDDEIIFKDFKPITMKHILEAYSENKENAIVPCPSNVNLVVPTYTDNHAREDSFISHSSNISALGFDEKTKKTLRNVQKGLKETELLLNRQKRCTK